MNEDKEGRRSFRVSESVYLKYEMLSDQEFQDGIEHRKIRRGESNSAQALLVDVESRLSESMYRLNGEHDQFGKCITLLNDKINVVIEAMPGLRQTKAALAQSLPLTCDVSADGIVFPAKDPLEPGTKLAVQLLIASDNRYVETFSRVVRITDTPIGNDPQHYPFGIAIEFHGMKASQREMLIQQMFNRESETLRMRRMNIEREET